MTTNINIRELFELEIKKEIYTLRSNEIYQHIEFFNQLLQTRDTVLLKQVMGFCSCPECNNHFHELIDQYKHGIIQKLHEDTQDNDYIEFRAIQQYIIDQIKRLKIEQEEVHQKLSETNLLYQQKII